MMQRDTFSLITASQSGDDSATDELLRIIKKEHMPKYIRRFLRRNVLVSQDEIESEFLEGCWRAIAIAKLDIGNPVSFICWKGSLKVVHLFRQKLKEGVRVNCSTCGTGVLMYKAKEKRAMCSKCGATDVDTYMVVMDESQMPSEFADGSDREDHAWDKIAIDSMEDNAERQFETIMYENTVQEIRSQLNGRVLQLFDKLVVECVNRDTSDNYLEEIANEWGVSTACVSVYLRKLRAKVATYYINQKAA